VLVVVFGVLLPLRHRHPVLTCIPVNKAYRPISVEPNPADSNLVGLHHHREMGLGLEFAGSQRVSVGFKQSVLELLTMPGDIVLNWAVGDSSTFLAGDLFNSFVVGAEDRSKFVDLAERAMADVRRRVSPAV
jgi:hypothetical protein